MSDTNADTLQRFIFENEDVRGELVHLRASYQAALGEVEYPGIVAEQLGQVLVASVLLGATIKFEGALIIQIQSTGPITMMVAQCTDQRHIRGLAHWQGELVDGDVADMFGTGSVAITINTKNHNDRYQGVVSLEGEKLAEALENYFQQSEQLPTRLFIFANQENAVGLLLQKLPGNGEDEDLWSRVNVFAETLTAPEMLGLSNEDILHRLFHEEDIRIFDKEPVSFRCTCSRQRIEDMLVSLGHEEVQAIIVEQGLVSIDCEFCNHEYTFDNVDVEQLFSSDFKPPAPDALQ